jgi:uncharacterized protein YjiS (DUF1127 family)
MIDYFKRIARYYNTVLELSRLSDRELRDLGMNRSEIMQEAVNQYWKSYVTVRSQSFR